MQVQVYLPWEIEFNEKYLNGSLSTFVPYAAFWDICIRREVKVTVNQLRSLAAGKAHPHPDDRAVQLGLMSSSRGDSFVYEEADELPTDSIIPAEVIAYYQQLKINELGNKQLVPARENGGLTLQEIKDKFPKLFENYTAP